MSSRFRFSVLAVSLSAILTGVLPAGAAPGSYHFVNEIVVGGTGGWDYLSIDAQARRLYVAHSTKIDVIDLEKRTVVGEISDTPGVHGFAIASDLGKGFSSNGGEAKSSVVDLKTLNTVSKVATGENPDAILYEPVRHEVYTFNGRGKSATVFDAVTGKVVATVSLAGKPEFAACDPAAGLVYCNIEDKNTVTVIDAKTHEVVNTWPIAPGEEATGLAIDLADKRLFIGCHNKTMVMINAGNGQVVATVPIGQGVDANAFDPGTQLVFSSNGEGTVTIAHLDAPDKLTVVQTLQTERGARTMALDPKTHRIYLASAKFGPVPEATPGAPAKRPQPIPGSFKISVYGPE